jgi:carbon-monoxide dehydrogenase large subunit
MAPSNIAGALGARAGLLRGRRSARASHGHRHRCSPASHSHGQGHETTFAQVVADKLGLPARGRGDRGMATPVAIPFGMGTYGSRSLSVGGTAIVKAVDKIIAKGKKIAAHLLEASDTDIEFEPTASFKVAGTDQEGAVCRGGAHHAYVPHNYPLDKLEPGLNENAFYDPDQLHVPRRLLCLRGRGRPGHRQGLGRIVHRGR